MNNLDKSNMIGSIDGLYLQLEQTWSDIKKIEVDPKYSKAENIVFVGMGGSALGPHIIKSIFFDKLLLEHEIVNGYNLPAYANEKTLIVLSSHSGTTEEVLNASLEALSKKCLVMGITTGGKLGEFLKSHNFPSYIFEEKHNPCHKPRMSLGYMILGTLGLLYRSGFLKIEDNEIKNSINLIKNNLKIKTQAQDYAKKLANKIIILVGSTFLSGTVHTFNNQLNENAKTLSSYFLIPELNHHLMEGLSHPKSNNSNAVFMFINSRLYHKRIQKRFTLTKEVVSKNGIEVLEFNPKGSSKLEQSFEVLLFGSYVSYYLALENHLDPSPIPWVDYFKQNLA